MMRKRIAAAGIVLVLCGCEGAAEAGPGTYRLVRSDSGPVPIALQADDGCFHMLMAGEVKLADNNHFTSSYTVQKACPGLGIEQFPMGSAGTIRVTGDSLVFEDTTGAVVGRGTHSRDSLVVAGPSHRLYYARQPE